jgi:hypothetical protein
MVFEVDPDKPNIPAIARILSGMGLVCLGGTVIAALLAFSRYEWVNETYAMAIAVGGFLVALIFVGQAKIIELLAIVSARVRSRFAIEGMMKPTQPGASPAIEKRPAPIVAAPKERIIHVPDDQAREQGFKVR